MYYVTIGPNMRALELFREGISQEVPPDAHPLTEEEGEALRTADRRADYLLDAGGVLIYAPDLSSVRARIATELKAIRQKGLDGISKSSGVQAVYDENRLAADKIAAGQGAEVLFEQVTAEEYGTDAGAKFTPAMSASEWAAFILRENDRERYRGKRIEEGYLEYAYSRVQSTDVIAELEALPGQYRDYVSALLSAQTLEEVKGVI